MAPVRLRIKRLEEVLALVRQLYDSGWANLTGSFVAADDLPRSPVPDRAAGALRLSIDVRLDPFHWRA